jgi:hypothetical protein
MDFFVSVMERISNRLNAKTVECVCVCVCVCVRARAHL